METRGRPAISRLVGGQSAARWLWVWAALLGAWAEPALAQVDWDAEISIDLQRASLRETLASFARIGGGELRMEPSVSGQVTLKTDGAPAFEILDQICKHHDLQCFWGGRPARLVVERSEGFEGLATSISLALRRADLQQTVQVMSTITNGRVRIEGELTGEVSVEILSAPWPVALAHICEDTGCSVDWSAEPYVVSPRSGRSKKGDGSTGLDLDGDRIDRRAEALVRSAPSAAWGPLRLEVEGSPPAATAEEIDSGIATWGEHFSRFCERRDCRWQLRYGQPSALLLTWLDPRVKGRVKLAAEARWNQPRLWSAPTLAARLAEELGVELVALEGLKLDGEVKVRQPELRWIELADTLCGVLRCRWRVEGERLWLSPTEAPLSLMPTVSAPAVETRLAVAGSDGVGLERTATFDWKRPVYRLPLRSEADPERKPSSGTLVVTWLPFSSELQWVVPFWLPCTGVPEVLPTSRVGSTRAEISVSLDFDVQRAEADGPVCLDPSSSDARLSVALAERQRGAWVRESRFTLEAIPGSYLMIAPPGALEGPATAVIFLGSDAAGRVLVALVSPRPDPDPGGPAEDVALRSDGSRVDPSPTVEVLALDGTESRSLFHGDRAYRLSLIPAG